MRQNSQPVLRNSKLVRLGSLKEQIHRSDSPILCLAQDTLALLQALRCVALSSSRSPDKQEPQQDTLQTLVNSDTNYRIHLYR